MSYGVPSSFGQFQTNKPMFGQSSSSAGQSLFGISTGTSTNASTFAGSTSSAIGQSSSSGGQTWFGVSMNNTCFMNTSPFAGSTTSSFGIGAGIWQTTENTTMDISEHSSFADKIASISAMSVNKSHEELRSADYELNIKGSRRSSYTASRDEEEIKGTKQTITLHSISAMPIYKDKSHEELRFKDYEERAKGVQTPWATKASVPVNPFYPSTSSFTPQSQTPTTLTPTISPSPFLQNNPLTPRSQGFVSPSNSFFKFPTPATLPQFFPSNNTTTSTTPVIAPFTNPIPSPTNPFTSFTTTTTPTPTIPPSPFPQNSPFTQPQPFTTPNYSFFRTSDPAPSAESIFRNNTTNVFEPTLQTSFPPTSTTTTPTPFEHLTSPNPSSPQTNSLTPTSPAFVIPPSTTLPYPFSVQTDPFAPRSQPLYFPTTPSIVPALNVSQPGQTSTTIPSQPSQGEAVGDRNIIGQQSIPLNVAMQPTLVTNPFGTRSAVNTSTQPEAVTSTPHGISSLPVKNNSAPVRISSSYRIRHLSTRRVSLPANRYYPESSGSKVPFFADKEYRPCLVAPFLPRENPRAWVMNEVSEQAHAPIATYKNGETCEDKAGANSCLQENENSVKVNNDPLVSSLMPKLPCGGEYYTEPSMKELEAKERAEPGFCSHVKNFVVGRKDKGSIRFLGETDIRHLDLESIVQFNDREIIVYKDDEKKPPVGQGLNRPAEVTLLNVKFLSKSSGKQFSDGHQVQKLETMLMKKANEQGAEFVLYNPVRGEWKIRVQHF